MKKSSLFPLFAVFMLLLTSCGKKTAEQLADAIPSSAFTVIRVDVMSLVKKADYNPLNNKTLKRYLNEEKELMEANRKEIAQFENFIKDPNSFGLNILDDCLIYFDNKGVGVLFKMNDEDKFKKTLTDTFGLPEMLFEKTDGVTYLHLEDDFIVCWTKDRLLLLRNTDYTHMGDDDIKARAIAQLKQKSSESINSNKAFGQFINNKKDISLFYSSQNAMQLLTDMFGYFSMDGGSSKALPDKVKGLFEGVAAGNFISFEKGEIKFDQEMYFTSSENKKKYEELINTVSADLKGKHLEYFPEKPVVVLSAGLKGAGLYEYMNLFDMLLPLVEEFEEVFESIEIDMQSFISSIDGDMTIAVNKMELVKHVYENYEYEEPIPEMSFFADFKDMDNIWNGFKKAIERSSSSAENVKEVNTNLYMVSTDDFNVYLGRIDNTLYITNAESIGKNVGVNQKNDFASKAKGERVFLYGNIGNLRNIIVADLKDDDSTELLSLVNKGLDLTGDYLFRASADMSVNGKMELTNKSDNSLAAIFNYVDEIITVYIESEY